MAELDPITVQVIGSAFRSICEEMGAALVRSSYSANIKERRDCSTALFDASGRLIAQAEHIPVHLGAMPDAVAAVLEHGPEPGDVFILNDPFQGGTHLPDITLVSPIDLDGEIIAYSANRAHHADVGGREPGSMPADSLMLEEEGVVIPPTRLVAGGVLDEDLLDLILAGVRRPGERHGDLRAQMGAGSIGARRLLELAGQKGVDVVLAAMQQTMEYSRRRMRAAIKALPDGVYSADDYLERGDIDLRIAAEVTVRGEEIDIDFAGTTPQEDGNLNSPMSVTRSACYYVVRVVTDPDIPHNAGALEPVTISAPEGCLVNAQPPAAVVGGNVEASQRIADTVLLALSHGIDLPAQGQGTMNNITLGNENYNYYETVGGGAGACPDRDGASGIHLGTTNTLNTPIEALEMAFPIRVERYELRRDSGGAGFYYGGEGVIRSLRLIEPARLSLLTDRRRHGPRGAAGGEPGSPGRNLINGQEVGGKITRTVDTWDLVTVITPGGGGYGLPPRGTGEKAAAAVAYSAEVESAPEKRRIGGFLRSRSSKVLLLLLCLDLWMVLLFALTLNNPNDAVMRAFNLDVENNVPSIYSTLLLVIASFSALICVNVDGNKRIGRLPARYLWYLIGAVLMFMAADELLSFHERSDYFLYSLYEKYPALEQLGGYGWPWTIAGLAAVLVVGVPAAVYTYRVFYGRRYLFYLLLASGVMFVVGAVGFENLSVYLDYFHSGSGNNFVLAIEESMEMISVSMTAYVFLRYREERVREENRGLKGPA